MSKPLITLDLKLAGLFEHYPQAESVLGEIAPAFAGLSDPILREHITRATTLERAATAAGLQPAELLATLRARLGQPVGDPTRRELPQAPTACTCTGRCAPADAPPPNATTPAWAESLGAPDRVVEADEILASGESPLGAVIAAAQALEPDQTLGIRVAFRPTPMIQKLEAEGYITHCRALETGRFELLVRRAQHSHA